MRRFVLMLLLIVCISLLTACSERLETADPLALDEENILSVNMEFEEKSYELEKEDISEFVTLLNEFVPTDMVSEEVTGDEKIEFKVNCREDNTIKFLLKGTKLITDDAVYEGDKNCVYELKVFAEKVSGDALQEKNAKDDDVKDEPTKTDTPIQPVSDSEQEKQSLPETHQETKEQKIEANTPKKSDPEALNDGEAIAEEPIDKETTSKESEKVEVVNDTDIKLVDDGPRKEYTEEELRKMEEEAARIAKEAEESGDIIAYEPQG